MNRQMIEQSQSGLLAGDDAGWSEALARLAGDAGLRRRCGAAGRRAVETKYSLAVQAPRLARLLHDVMERR